MISCALPNRLFKPGFDVCACTVVVALVTPAVKISHHAYYSN